MNPTINFIEEDEKSLKANEITERQYKQIMTADTNEGNKFKDFLSTLDMTMTHEQLNYVIQEMATGGDNSWQNYVPSIFLSMIMHLETKTPEFYKTICPSTIVADRDPVNLLELADPEDEKQNRVDWVSMTGQHTSGEITYGKRELNLRRWGWKFNYPIELLGEIPLSITQHTLLDLVAREIQFKNNWLTSEMHRWTSDNGGTDNYETNYGNTYQADGGEVSWQSCQGTSISRTLGISVIDILQALHQFSLPLTPDTAARGRLVKGTNYYSPSMVVVSPTTGLDLALELLLRQGGTGAYSQWGPEQGLAGQVRTSGFLSNIFQVPIIVMNTARWLTSADTKTTNNFDLSNNDAYIVDNRWLTNLIYKDGEQGMLQTWINQDRRVESHAKTVRSMFHCLDFQGILRIKPCPAGS